MRRRKHPLVEGLSRGLECADVPGLGRGIGEGLVRVSEAWLPRGKFAIPQRCYVKGCEAGPYSSVESLRNHLCTAHAGLGDREKRFVLDQAQRGAVQAAMNGVGRAP